DKLVVHTKQSSADLVDKFDIDTNKICIAPHGPLNLVANLDLLDAEIIKLKDKYKFDGKIIFSLLGYQSTYKGTDLLIDAWKNNPNLLLNENVCLVIAGKFQDIKPIESIHNLVVIPQKLDNLTFDALMNLTNVMVLPYRRIDQSGLLLTLINHNIPYCATRVGELTYPIEKESLGWIIEDTKSLGSILESIIQNPHSIKIKKNNAIGWDRIQRHYNWDNAATSLAFTYRNLGETIQNK
ncbi:MAG: hypothetical protein NC453_30035, partial [Muribaculum sp.]|nr:hypothetical protein [Muribaculum sp.]